MLAWLSALTFYDLRWRRLPNWLTLPGAAVVLIAAALAGRGGPAAMGAAALFALYAATHLLAPAALGAGDAKLALGVGGLTGAFGPDVWLLAALSAPLLTSACALLLPARRERTVPHGPSMCVASAAAIALVLF
ncbi:prepilin peptidase [Mycolicibacterium litorale]|uniref:Prepilin peptidase n=1 Tax=Mycolicibacterium litorale TaxID=758802 RepID=A0AAD1IJ71_9MYCO|nr:prepilin peptidase [Mycolicibacterium litorale]TDY08401.1 leader peptidase (prepilin peptidase)/N-methyltransferase [Mycolicibacterium litorale]BBY16325.1 prepilin peptidase [Mycolicibacterium litorale]